MRKLDQNCPNHITNRKRFEVKNSSAKDLALYESAYVVEADSRQTRPEARRL
jgi:hypothetical protein